MNIIENIGGEINPQYLLLKSQLDYDLNRTTVKFDNVQGSGYLQPEVSPSISRYVVLHNGKLNKCTSVLAQDTVLQDYTFEAEEEDEITQITNFWNKANKYQLYLAVKERYQYGWGCLEILFDEYGLPERIVQFPAYTAIIKKKGDLYYAVQRQPGSGQEKELRLMNLLDEYPDEDNDLPICLWLGGGATHEFYDVPAWFPDVDKILAQINLDMLNAEQINQGNNLDGILMITGHPQRPDDEGILPQERLRREIKSAGTGSMVMYLESMGEDSSLDIQYITIGKDNWDYLESFSENCDKALMSDYSIPKVRLMIDDVTESMNSNKSDTIWEIYTISLNYEQYSNELIIREFNRIFFDADYEVEMETPVFTDKEQTSLDSLLKLFNSGLITVGQAIEELQLIKPSLNLDDVDLDAPMMEERFYNGNVLGLSDINEDEDINLIEWLKGAELT